MYSPDVLFGPEFDTEEYGLAFSEMIETVQRFERERTLTFGDLDKMAFIGTVTGAGRIAKGTIIAAIFTIALLGHLFICLETNSTLTKRIWTELQDVKKGFIALFPLVGGRVLVWIERMEEEQMLKDWLGLDLDELDWEDDISFVDEGIQMDDDLEDSENDDEMVNFDLLQQRFQALSQGNSFVCESRPSVEYSVLEDEDYGDLFQRMRALSDKN
ncbi:MAG: hypothetical protein HKM07_08270 [Chlamydiae bacterium]|nr:hypothetical protein [Chlamydiota bacterium]